MYNKYGKDIDQFLVENYKLLLHLAYKFSCGYPRHIREYLTGEAVFAYIDAAYTFDETTGAKFSTYLAQRIIWRIQKFNDQQKQINFEYNLSYLNEDVCHDKDTTLKMGLNCKHKSQIADIRRYIDENFGTRDRIIFYSYLDGHKKNKIASEVGLSAAGVAYIIKEIQTNLRLEFNWKGLAEWGE